MIRVLKIGNTVYQGIEAKCIDKNGNELWNIPQNLEDLRNCAIDTINWQAGMKLKKSDWIVTKIAEIQIEGGDVTTAKAKYNDILKEREAIRKKSNELVSKVNACSNFDELLEVVKDLRL